MIRYTFSHHNEAHGHVFNCDRASQDELDEVRGWLIERMGTAGDPDWPWCMTLMGLVAIRAEDRALEFKMRWC